MTSVLFGFSEVWNGMTMSDSLFFFFKDLIIDSGQGNDEETLVDDRNHIPFPTIHYATLQGRKELSEMRPHVFVTYYSKRKFK